MIYNVVILYCSRVLHYVKCVEYFGFVKILALPFKLYILTHVVLLNFFPFNFFFFHFKMSNNLIYVVFLCVWMCDSSWSTYVINIFLYLPFASVVAVNNNIFYYYAKQKLCCYEIFHIWTFILLWDFKKKNISIRKIVLCWKLFHGINYQLQLTSNSHALCAQISRMGASLTTLVNGFYMECSNWWFNHQFGIC